MPTTRKNQELNVRLMLAKLTPPGTAAYADREGEFFEELDETLCLAPEIVAATKRVQFHDADNACQEQWKTMLEKLRDGRMYEVSRTYVDNGVKNHLKAARGGLSAKVTTNVAFDQNQPQAEPNRDGDSDELIECLQAAGGTPQEIEILTSYFIFGKSYTEIARDMGLHNSAVFIHKKRAFEKLRRYYTRIDRTQ